DAAGWKVRLAIDAGTAVGVYPIRVVTDSGVSNPILFAAGQVPQVLEVESNDTFDKAQPIPSPVVVEGECSGNDEGFFRCSRRAGLFRRELVMRMAEAEGTLAARFDFVLDMR